MSAPDPVAEGARNLLVGRGGLTAGDAVLVVKEDPALGWYDASIGDAVMAEARRLGLDARGVTAGGPADEPAPDVAAAIEAAPHVVRLARLGDRDRFAPAGEGRRVVMCYARSAAMLGSSYGRTEHGAMLALKDAVAAATAGAERIEVRCPLGTHVVGRAPAGQTAADVGVRRVPMGVPPPVPAEGFAGLVVLARWLVPTGSRPYAPAVVRLGAPVTARVEGARIAALDGAADVAAVRGHHDRAAALFGIDADAVHSWHAGLHPGCDFPGRAEDDPDLWANTVFTHPRMLHLHTCGAYAPGEVCWTVMDAAVRLDGAALWDRGRLRPERIPATRTPPRTP